MTLFIRLLHPLLVLLFPFAAFRFARRSKNGPFKTDPTDRRTFCFFLPTPPPSVPLPPSFALVAVRANTADIKIYGALRGPNPAAVFNRQFEKKKNKRTV